MRRTVLLVAALLLSAPSVADAHHAQRHARPVIAPAHRGGELLADAWTPAYEDAEGQDPFAGRCITLAHNVIAPHPGADDIATCTAPRHTRLLVFWGSACSTVDTDSCVGETHAQQLAAAVAADRAIKAENVTVDGGRTVDLVRRRFELFSPQRTVELPPGNIFGVDPQTATFSAHAWGAEIRRLRPGHHTVTVEIVVPEFGVRFTYTVLLDVA
jgi:hypothetical protein